MGLIFQNSIKIGKVRQGSNLNQIRSQKITITGSTAGIQTNYQIKITVAYNSRMQTNFDDIRFTSSDGITLLDYWLESKIDSLTADFWVKVPSIPASPSTVDIYMYYGYSGVASLSNGTNTFPFFDDFSQDLSKWTVASGTWNLVHSDFYPWSFVSNIIDGVSRYSHPKPFELLNGDIIVGFYTNEEGLPPDLKLIRSTDEGKTWGDKTTIAIASTNIYEGSFLQLSDGTLIVAYGDGVITYLKRSTDNGATWGSATTINVSSGLPEDTHPSLVHLANGNIFIALMDNQNIIGLISTDGGNTWGSKITISAQAATEYDPSVVQMQNGDLFVSFLNANANAVQLKKSTDGGNTWGSLTTVDTQAAGNGSNIDPNLLVTEDNTLLVAFAVGANADARDVYTRESSDGGVTWGERKLAYIGGDAHRFNLLKLQSGNIVGALATNEGDSDYHLIFLKRGLTTTTDNYLVGSNILNTYYSYIYAKNLNIGNFVLDFQAYLATESRGIAAFIRDVNPSAEYEGATSNRYVNFLRTLNDTFNFFKVINGVQSNILSTPVNHIGGIESWYNFRVVANGSSLASYIEDMTTPVASGIDASLSTGTIGLSLTYQDTIRFRNVRVRNYVTPEPTYNLI